MPQTPLTTCLLGPAFSLSGAAYFSDTNINFEVIFNAAEDEQAILAFEWFLDDILVLDERGAAFNGKVYCGSHKVGVRLLSNQGDVQYSCIFL